MIGCRDVEVARETSASVMGGGVAMRGNCSGSDSRDGVEGELLCVAGVDCGGDSDASGGIFEAAVRGGGVSGDCRNGAGVCENYEWTCRGGLCTETI